MSKPPKRPLEERAVVAAACRHYNLNPEDFDHRISGGYRGRVACDARMAVTLLLRAEGSHSYPEISRLVGWSGHVSAICSHRAGLAKIKRDEAFFRSVNAIEGLARAASQHSGATE